MILWDIPMHLPCNRDGKPVAIGILVSAAQVHRWHSAGYDVHAFMDRHFNMLRECETMGDDFEGMEARVDTFYADEAEYARSMGIDERDPDFWRFASAPMHYEFA